MATYDIPQGGWNLFASILQEMLAAHGLGHLEETLMDRINPEDALKVARQIFGIIEQALQEHVHDLVGIGAIKGGGAMASDENEIDRKLGNALTAIDHAAPVLKMHENSIIVSQFIE
jgi:hypothetical protein